VFERASQPGHPAREDRGVSPGGDSPRCRTVEPRPGKIEVVTFLGAAVRLVVRMGEDEVISDVIEKEFEQRQLKQEKEIFLYFLLRRSWFIRQKRDADEPARQVPRNPFNVSPPHP